MDTALTVPVFNTEGKQIETLELDRKVFDGNVNQAAVHQAVNSYLANQRKGLASTKTRGEVSGGGRKPWKQKGTGRARVGSTRNPLWYHGGVVFGPHPRDFSYSIPKKIKNLALRSALCAKVKEENFIVLDNFAIPSAKTKEAVKILGNLKIGSGKKDSRTTLLLVEKLDESLKRSVRNIDRFELNIATATNPYEVITANRLLITREGLKSLVARLKG